MIVLLSEFELFFNFKSICLCVIFLVILYILYLISYIFFFVELSDLIIVLNMLIKLCVLVSVILLIS